MSILFHRFRNFCQKHPQIILGSAILIYIIIFSLISFWKYYNFAYNGIDLAIYNQVFWNTAQGRFFESSIQAGSYLGDHFEPLILLLLPFYLIFKSPLTLLVLQTIFLALGAIPIYLISKNLTKKTLVSCLLSLAYLLNPFVQNINLFEFHLLPFAIPLLLFAFYFYQKRKLLPFYLFIFLSLLAREDVALVVFMFGILTLIDYFRTKPDRPINYLLKWVFPLLLLSIIWFISVLKVIDYFNAGNYKYLVYYSWLGNNFFDLIKNFFLHPLLVARRVLNLYNLVFLIGLLLPFGFLPILKPRYLILLLPPLLQTVLGMGGSEGVLETHYVSLFLPALFLGLIFVIKDSWLELGTAREKSLLIISLFLAATLYSFAALGPLPGSIRIILNRQPEETKIRNYFLNQIPPGAPVLSSYEFFPNLSSRQKLYPLHYVYLGKKQFGQGDYALPEDTQYLLIDFADIISFDFQFKKQPGYQKYLASAPDRLREILTQKNFGLVEMIDTLALFKKNYLAEKNFSEIRSSPYPPNHPEEINLDNQIKFLGFDKETLTKKIDNTNLTISNYNFSWQALDQPTSDYQIKITAFDQANRPLGSKYYPLAYGIYPASRWRRGEIVQTNYWFWLPSGTQKIKISLVKLEGGIELDDLRQAINVIDRETILGAPIEID